MPRRALDCPPNASPETGALLKRLVFQWIEKEACFLLLCDDFARPDRNARRTGTRAGAKWTRRWKRFGEFQRGAEKNGPAPSNKREDMAGKRNKDFAGGRRPFKTLTIGRGKRGFQRMFDWGIRRNMRLRNCNSVAFYRLCRPVGGVILGGLRRLGMGGLGA